MYDTERYERFKEKDLILRDQLAIDRTKLSNDRTLMSFARTALTLFIAGVTALHFIAAQDLVWRTLGWLFTFAGPVVFLIGLRRYQQMFRAIVGEHERLIAEKKRSHLGALHLDLFRHSATVDDPD